MSLIFSILVVLHGLVLGSVFADDGYALDDAHNHDGTHVDGQENCGGNYMFPGDVARLGSHSFLILGEDGPEHLLLDHRSGTPPHTYQFILRVKVTPAAMATYHKLLAQSKIARPAVTTIYFDKTGKQVDRTFFCLQDLPKIFGPGQTKGDAFEKLFPIRATWQVNADFEGAFPIEKTIVPSEDPLVINRADVELVVYRYLPSYLEQTGFRKMLKEKGAAFTSLLSDAPIRHDEPESTARTHKSYAETVVSNGEFCSADYYLKKVRPRKTRHAFLLLAEIGKNRVLASHLYDQAPQNFQTLMEFELPDAEMKLFRESRAKGPPLFIPDQFYCMADAKKLARSLRLTGPLYKNPDLVEFNPGEKIGDLHPRNISIPVNRTLQSLMNPQAVARDVFGFVDVRTLNPNIHVDSRYASDWNFIGRPIDGYRAGRCYLTEKAAKALSEVAKDVSKEGYELLAFDCYRPQRAVNEFVKWVSAPGDEKMKAVFYPGEEKHELINRGYIDAKSGHSRGSTIDLTLVRKSWKPGREKVSDCRKSTAVKLVFQLDMGTTFDCFSERAYTADQQQSVEALKNRALLKQVMERHGFRNYPKEWWHFTLNDEPYKADFFDFEVQ